VGPATVAVVVSRTQAAVARQQTLRIASLAALVLSTIVSAAQEPTPADLHRMLLEITRSDPLPGVLVAVTSPAQTLALVGVGDYADASNASAAAPYLRVGSVTKLFNGLLVLRLVQAGLLRLDLPCPATLPGCPRNPAGLASETPTAAHLLEHTSGM